MNNELLDIECNNCKRVLSIPARFAGTTGKCNHCGHSIAVTAPGVANTEDSWGVLLRNSEALCPSCGSETTEIAELVDDENISEY
jgi:rRNA maturation endonuclease Nob1